MKERDVITETSRFLKRSDVAFLFHLLAFSVYVRVWIWHTTPAALVLPGATGWGWFFRYLTFWSYSLQLIQLGLAVFSHMSRHPKRRIALKDAANVLAGATFGIANTVTAMFYAIESSTQGLVEGGKEERPWWLALAVHAFNSMVAWVDLFIVEERSFSGKSRHLALIVAGSYSAWLLVVKYKYGKFPYPVMNDLPFPWGYLGFLAVGVSVVMGTFEAGKFVKHTLLNGENGQTSRRKSKGRHQQIEAGEEVTKRQTRSRTGGGVKTA